MYVGTSSDHMARAIAVGTIVFGAYGIRVEPFECSGMMPSEFDLNLDLKGSVGFTRSGANASTATGYPSLDSLVIHHLGWWKFCGTILPSGQTNRPLSRLFSSWR